MTNISFDLIDVIRTIQKQKRFIIIVTLAGMALAGAALLVKKKKYKAEARFLVNNPLYGDRHTLFRSYETRYVDYYGGDDDVDKIMALAASDTVRDRIIRNCDFDKIYKREINTAKGHDELMMIFNKNFNIKRTEYKDVQVSYTAYRPEDAAGVANMAVKVLEETYRSYYTNVKTGIYRSIGDQKLKLDSAIAALTDTLAAMRDQYGIYAILSPTRKDVINGDLKGGGKGYGRAIEEIQNIESVKDQLVTDRAHYISMLNEFDATTNSAMGYLKVITRALPPTNPAGLGTAITLVAAALLSFFFSTLYVLIMAYYRKLNAVER
ncbi:hypothetical protein GCM10023093_17490 [Nemorincola caseinilytica]|uniref:Polysaccharide chain length determinant N-terminal domain-containing protein n=1 Tax=Nemorincola caseinilytica TaxID=2054315 RepID=A0ABP8NDS7_9BACT